MGSLGSSAKPPPATAPAVAAPPAKSPPSDEMSRAAHDLANALMVVTSQVDLARDRLSPSDPVREHLDVIAAAAANAQRVARVLARR